MALSFHPALQPLLGGILIGLAAWLLLASLGRVAGITGIVRGALFAPWADPKLSANSTPAAAAQKTQTSDRLWRWAFLLGLVGGGWLFAQVLGSTVTAPKLDSSPAMLAKLAVGGLLVGLGTAVGSGCTSGHGVCGLGRRSLRSLFAVLTFMATGMLTVAVLRMA